jgi:hypothetical protein
MKWLLLDHNEHNQFPPTASVFFYDFFHRGWGCQVHGQDQPALAADLKNQSLWTISQGNVPNISLTQRCQMQGCQ